MNKLLMAVAATSMAIPAAPRANASRKRQRVDIVSLMVVGTCVPRAKVASASRSSARSGSSYQ